VATAIGVLNTVLFCALTAAFITRYIRWPHIVRLTLSHPLHVRSAPSEAESVLADRVSLLHRMTCAQSLFLGTWPMSSLTCISGIISISQGYGLGDSWLWAMSYSWWITVRRSVSCGRRAPTDS
jgi:tellurite resistance protein TehA-like permease